jgi:hypothetical protein
MPNPPDLLAATCVNSYSQLNLITPEAAIHMQNAENDNPSSAVVGVSQGVRVHPEAFALRTFVGSYP